MSKAEKKPKKYEERLMESLGFDEDDLEANRDGELTPEQRIRLDKVRKQTIWLWALLILFLSAVLAIWLSVSQSLGIASVETILIPIAVYVLAILGSYFPFGLKSRRLLADMRENRVLSAEGRVDLALSSDQNNVRYRMQVDNVGFPLKKGTFLAFKNGDPYRIYYLPRTKQVLSAEWLREDEPRLSKLLSSEAGDEMVEAPDTHQVDLPEKAKRE